MLRPLSRKALKLIEVEIEEREEREKEEKHEGVKEKLIIPSTVLHEAFSELYRYGKHRREWIVALGYQKINGKQVVTHVYRLKCRVSRAAEAEPDYGDLSKALSFYERCGAQIAGLAHVHPWNASDVSPSSVDIETHSRWEELYDGKFIGIVFTNSGVFRIFHAGNCKFKPVIVGNGVRRIKGDLYELERACVS